MVDGGMKCVKYLLFMFNLVFFLAGLGLIIAGAVVQTRFKDYLDFFGSTFSAVAVVAIIIGCVIFVIGFFGCCGAYKEQYCMIMTFAVLLAVIFVLEIAAGIAAYALRGKIEHMVNDKLNAASAHFGDEGHEGVTKAWNVLQHDFKCCGVDNYTTWEDYSTQHNDSLPNTCCRENIGESCGSNPGYPASGATLDGKYWDKGCVDGFEKWIKNNVFIVGGVGIGFAFVQIVGIILACCLARSIKKEYEVV